MACPVYNPRSSKIVDTKAEADALVAKLARTHWGIFVEKTNRANKKYGAGKYIVSWGEQKIQNPGFLPKSLFDRYVIRVVGEDYKVDRIQTLAGAEHKLKQVAKKFPCNSIEIVSEKFGTVVKSYRPSGGAGTPKVDKDNSRDYKVKEKQAVKDDVKFVLYLDGQEYATYDTKKEAEQVGKKEGGRVRVKEVRGNPVQQGTVNLVPHPRHKGYFMADKVADQNRVSRIGWGAKPISEKNIDSFIDAANSAMYDVQVKGVQNPKDAHGIEQPVILDAPRPLHKVYGPNWMKRPDAAELKRAFTKATSARSKSLKAYKAYVEESNRQFHARRGNPELDERGASDLFKTFHGVPSTGALDYEESFVEPDAYAELGDLIELWVIPIHGKGSKAIKIEAPNPDEVGPNEVVKLASSPEANQLYFIGGDQSLDVRAMGFTSREERSNMFIGVLAELTYRAKKKFHKLKLTDYYHKLGEESGNEPILIYDAHSEKMAVAGGNYEVRDVGIVD